LRILRKYLLNKLAMYRSNYNFESIEEVKIKVVRRISVYKYQIISEGIIRIIFVGKYIFL